ARSTDDRVSRSEGKLHGPNGRLVASDAGLRHRADGHLRARGGGCLGADGSTADSHGLAVLGASPLLATLLAHGTSSLRLNSTHAGGWGSRFRSVGCDLGWVPPACCWAVGLNRVRRGLRHVVSRAQLYR